MSERITSRGCVYVLSTPGGYHKIGVAHDAEGRRRALQTGNHEPLTLVGATLPGDGPDAYQFESAMHKLLNGCRAQGEWFKISLGALLVLWAYAYDRLARD